MNQPTPNPTPAGLRACPFCGTLPTVYEDGLVSCNNLDCWLFDMHTGEAEAWNRRAPEVPRCAGNEDAVREAAKRLADQMDEDWKAGEGFTGATIGFHVELKDALSAPVPQPPAGNEELREAAVVGHVVRQTLYATGTPFGDLEKVTAYLIRNYFTPEILAQQNDIRKAALAQAEPASTEAGGWQSIETAPKDGTPILACADGEVLVAEFDGGADAWRLLGSSDEVWPQAWMPLPAQPACNGTGKATACRYGCKDGVITIDHTIDHGIAIQSFQEEHPCPDHGHGKREGDR